MTEELGPPDTGPPSSGPQAVPPSPLPADDGDPEEWEWLPRRTSTLTRVLIVLSSLGVVLLIAALWAKSWLDDRLDPPGEEGLELVVDIPLGASTNDIARILEDEMVVANSTVFRYYLRYKDAGDFQAGSYTFNQNMAVWGAKDVLLAGPSSGVVDPNLRVVIPEGFTLVQLQTELLAQVPAFSATELTAAVAFPPTRSLYQPPNTPLEGMLFPDTYLVDEATSGDEAGLITRMLSRFDEVAAEIGLDDSQAAVGLSPYEVVIVASLIEREALIDEDRAKIARVIYNRLAAGWRLEIDAAVRYAVGKAPGEPLTVSDLETESPFNVYLNTGLPPTPIAAPGEKSLLAALNPVEGGWMFYVRTDDPVEGAHTFTFTVEEHEAAVEVCRERNLGC